MLLYHMFTADLFKYGIHLYWVNLLSPQREFWNNIYSIIQYLAIRCCPNKQYSKEEPSFEKKIKETIYVYCCYFLIWTICMKKHFIASKMFRSNILFMYLKIVIILEPFFSPLLMINAQVCQTAQWLYLFSLHSVPQWVCVFWVEVDWVGANVTHSPTSALWFSCK